jgi:hypothetical protein
MTQAELTLRSIAQRAGGRLSAVHLISRNIGEVARWRLRFSRRRRRVTIYAADGKLSVEVPVADGLLLFAINQPDQVCFADKRLNGLSSFAPFPVFVSDDVGAERVRSWLAAPHVDLIRRLDLRDDEAMFVFGNVVQCVCRSDRDHVKVADVLIEIAGDLPLRHQRKPRTSDLPADLRPLARLFSTWAFSDDEERSERIDRATPRQRAALLRTVDPITHRIDEYLASFGDKPLTDVAMLVAAVAEAAAEIRAMRPNDR